MHAWPGMVGWLAGVIYLLPLTQDPTTLPEDRPDTLVDPAQLAAERQLDADETSATAAAPSAGAKALRQPPYPRALLPINQRRPRRALPGTKATKRVRVPAKPTTADTDRLKAAYAEWSKEEQDALWPTKAD